MRLTGYLLALLLFSQPLYAEEVPLPSWKESPAKRALTDFVQKVTTEGGPDFVEPEERIAVFDNDGTLWAEQPMYVQLAFVFDRIRALAPQHPEWKSTEPFKSVLAGDLKAALAGGEKSASAMLMATHTGMTTDKFESIVTEWIATAKHPKTGKLYTEMIYQPMVEVLDYLRSKGIFPPRKRRRRLNCSCCTRQLACEHDVCPHWDGVYSVSCGPPHVGIDKCDQECGPKTLAKAASGRTPDNSTKKTTAKTLQIAPPLPLDDHRFVARPRLVSANLICKRSFLGFGSPGRDEWKLSHFRHKRNCAGGQAI